MANVVDVGNISGSGDQGNQSTYNWQHTNSVDVKILALVVRTRDTSENDSDISAITYDGDNAVEGVALYDAGSDMGVQVWYVVSPTADGAGKTLEVTFKGTVSDSSVVAIGIEGAAIVDPIDLTDTDVVAAGDVTLDFTGRAAGAIAIGGSVLDENTPNKLSVITGTEADEVDMGSYQANSAYIIGDAIVMGSADGDVDFVGAGVTFKVGVTEFSLSVTDGVKLGDSRSEAMAANPTITDGLKGGDATSELGVMETLISDGIKLGDSTVGAILLLLSLTDGIKIGDTTVESMITDSIVTDGVKIGDSLSEEMSSIVIVLDGVKLGDTTTESMIANVLATDGIKFGDNAIATLVLSLIVTDGALFGDTPLIETGIVTFDLSVTDGINVGDSNLLGMASFVLTSDGIKIGDINIIGRSSEVSISEGIKLGDITVGNINLFVVLSDGIKLGDIIVKTGNFARGAKNLGQSRELKTYLRFIEQRRRI